ncbi:MAG: 5'/3'-nucleotidase SurE [Pseudomonadota bacterium]
MRILITNDDGINAPGLEVLGEIAGVLAGPDGEVWTVAPAFEQSGVAHRISYTHPLMIAELAPRRFAVEGAPADCVLAGLHNILPHPPDLILSGVNRGNNAAENTLYSGTVGACIEAALQGYRSIALSQFYGPNNRDLAEPFESSSRWGVDVINRLLAADLWGSDPYSLFYNVNFPPCSAEATRGVQVTTQGRRAGVNFHTEPYTAPSGRRFIWITGGGQHVETAPGTDNQANLEHYISVTPMRCDLTAYDTLASLKEALE